MAQNRYIRFAISIITNFLSFFIKRNDDYIAFGSWCGEFYIDNSRYLFERALNRYPNKTFVWVGNAEVKKIILNRAPDANNIIVVEKDSFESIILLLKCKNMFFSQMHDKDICSYNVYRGAVLTYLHHGFPIKKWAADGVNEHKDLSKHGIKRFISKINGHGIPYDYFVVSSEKHKQSILSSLDYKGCKKENIIPSGTPRDDFLINMKQDENDFLKQKYSEEIGFDVNKKIILYLPTFRRSGKATRSFTSGLSQQEENDINEILCKKDAVIIEKNHYVEDETNGGNNVEVLGKFIFHVDQKVNTQELLSIADVLISDYSSAIMDYVLLDRPIIYYVYDYDFYKETDSGLYYDIQEYAAGEVVEDFCTLLKAVKHSLDDPLCYSKRRTLIRNKFMEYEKGYASDIILNTVIEKDCTI